MSTFTKGPWMVAPFSDTDEVLNVVADYGEVEIKGRKVKQAHWIAELDASLDFTSDREVELGENIANAHLISAAPDLLAVLKEYVEWFGAVHGDECPADDTCVCIGGGLNARVNAAIKKAEGKS